MKTGGALKDWDGVAALNEIGFISYVPRGREAIRRRATDWEARMVWT